MCFVFVIILSEYNFSFEYLWADEQNKKPIKMSAPEYVEHLMSWVQHYLDDDTMFPSSTGAL